MPSLAIIVVIALLGGGAAFEFHLLMKAHEDIATQKVLVAEKEGIIRQKEADAKLSAQLLALQTTIETKLRTVGSDTRQAINNASSDDGAANAARDGVMRLRSAAGSPRTPTP